MLKAILHDAEERMKKTTEVFRRDLATLRAGRAAPALLEKVLVDYYGTMTPVNQMANIHVPEPRLLVIQPWDKTMVGNVEKAILKSDLGLTPHVEGNIIRLVIPQLTEERRTELVRSIKKKAEEERVAIRNIRRDANEDIKELEKDGEYPEDDCHRTQDEVQKLTDKYIEVIDKSLQAKEKEIMEV